MGWKQARRQRPSRLLVFLVLTVFFFYRPAFTGVVDQATYTLHTWYAMSISVEATSAQRVSALKKRRPSSTSCFATPNNQPANVITSRFQKDADATGEQSAAASDVVERTSSSTKT